MGENLSELLKLALSDEKVKQMLINTRSEGDPMDAFCNAVNSLGFEISLADLVWGGEEYCAAMLRSVNGGGVDAFDSWTDFYELFFASLER